MITCDQCNGTTRRVTFSSGVIDCPNCSGTGQVPGGAS